MTEPTPSSLTEAVTLRSAILSTSVHVLLVLLMLGGPRHPQDPADVQMSELREQEEPDQHVPQPILRLPATTEQTDTMLEAQSVDAPLPSLDLDALPSPLDSDAIRAAPAPSLGEPAADSRLGPLSDGGLEINLPALDRIHAIDIAPAITASARRPDTDQRLREWQNVAEYLQDIILRRNWHRNWRPRFDTLITNRDLIAQVAFCPRGFISRFHLIRGTGVDELDGLIEGFFQNAERLSAPPISADNPMGYLHLRLP